MITKLEALTRLRMITKLEALTKLRMITKLETIAKLCSFNKPLILLSGINAIDSI